jgi:glucose-6-phosphate 1-dehydrogenase
VSSPAEPVIRNLVLFGATGDLAGRFLLPALAAVRAAGRLPDEFALVGSASEPWDEETFRRHAAACLSEYAGDVPLEHRDALTRRLRYRPADATDAAAVAEVVRSVGPGPLAAYVALPPGLFAPVVTALGNAGLPLGSRVALEKPFGESLDDAVRLNRVVAEAFGEACEQVVFRVDHVLGMATVRNLLALRRHHTVLAALWDAEHVEQIEVRWEEDLALEDRAGYYDTTGALVDVMQNHMLQVLSIVAMEPPADEGERALRDAKVAVLGSARLPTPDELSRCTRRGRYGAGRVGDRAIPAYVDEEGVDPSRGTETFAEVVVSIDTPRWRGTRFVLRAGKALRQRRKDVLVRFRSEHGDELRIGIDGPQDISLRLCGAGPMTLSGTPPSSELPPYGHVLLDVLEGGSSLAVRGDGAEAAWRLMTPVVEAWRANRVPLEEYPAGSAGPAPRE